MYSAEPKASTEVGPLIIPSDISGSGSCGIELPTSSNSFWKV